MTKKYTLGNCILLCISVAALLWDAALWCVVLLASQAAWTSLAESEKDTFCSSLLAFTLLATPAAGWLLWWFKGSE